MKRTNDEGSSVIRCRHWTLKTPAQVSCITGLENGFLAVGMKDGSILVYNRQNELVIQIDVGRHVSALHVVRTISSHRVILAAGTKEGRIEFIKVQIGDVPAQSRVLGTAVLTMGGCIREMLVHLGDKGNDGLLVAASEDKSILVVFLHDICSKLANPQWKWMESRMTFNGWIRCIELLPVEHAVENGTPEVQVAVGCGDKSIHIVSVKTKRESGASPRIERIAQKEINAKIHGIATAQSREGKRELIIATDTRGVRLFDAVWAMGKWNLIDRGRIGRKAAKVIIAWHQKQGASYAVMIGHDRRVFLHRIARRKSVPEQASTLPGQDLGWEWRCSSMFVIPDASTAVLILASEEGIIEGIELEPNLGKAEETNENSVDFNEELAAFVGEPRIEQLDDHVLGNRYQARASIDFGRSLQVIPRPPGEPSIVVAGTDTGKIALFSSLSGQEGTERSVASLSIGQSIDTRIWQIVVCPHSRTYGGHFLHASTSDNEVVTLLARPPVGHHDWTLELRGRIQISAWPRAMALDLHSKRLLIGAEDGVVHALDTFWPRNQEASQVAATALPVRTLATATQSRNKSEDSIYIIGAESGIIRCYEDREVRWEQYAYDKVRGIILLDGSCVAACEAGFVYKFDSETGSLLAKVDLGDRIVGLAFEPATSTLAVCCEEDVVFLDEDFYVVGAFWARSRVRSVQFMGNEEVFVSSEGGNSFGISAPAKIRNWEMQAFSAAGHVSVPSKPKKRGVRPIWSALSSAALASASPASIVALIDEALASINRSMSNGQLQVAYSRVCNGILFLARIEGMTGSVVHRIQRVAYSSIGQRAAKRSLVELRRKWPASGLAADLDINRILGAETAPEGWPTF